MSATEEHLRQLQDWSSGDPAREAATDLLIHEFDGRFADAGRPWVKRSSDGPRVDFAAIPASIGRFSSGEQAFLRLVASLGSPDVDTNLYRDLAGLDRGLQRAFADAVRQASGPVVRATVWGPPYADH